ncbi:MAG: hypothetical protein U0175_07710 [Caldilineaceae bacterium]
MTNWAEIRAELDQMLELERSAVRQQRQQQWQQLLQQSKRLRTFLAYPVQWIGILHSISTHG